MTVVNVSTVTQAIKTTLEASTDLTGVTITRADAVNEDINIACNGWVGIYRSQQDLPPRSTNTRNQNIQLVIACQAGSLASGEACEDALELLIKNVLEQILADPTLGGTVINIAESLTVRYEQYIKQGDGFMQLATIFVTGIHRFLV